MAVKAVFEADVSNFKAGVESATKDLEGFQNAANAASVSISGRLKTSLGDFDSLLRAAGINIGVEARALTELANAADQTFTSLGALGTAGLVVADALASWKLGEKIGEWTGLTDKIERDAEALSGWNLKAEEAAAKADTLAAASRAVGRAVTDMGEALKVISALGAGTALKSLTQEWSDDIARLQQMGKLDEFTKAVDSHQFSVKQLADAYGLATDSVSHFESELRNSDKAWADEQHAVDTWAKGIMDAQAKWAAENKRGMEEWEKDLERSYISEMKLYTDAIKMQDTLNEKILKQYTQRELQTGLEITAGKDVAASNVARTQGAIIPDQALAAATQLDKDLQKANDLYAEAAKSMGDVAANLKQAADEYARQAYLNYDVRTGARAPEAGIAGPQTTQNININVSGILDPRTIEELKAAISQSLLQGTGAQYPNR